MYYVYKLKRLRVVVCKKDNRQGWKVMRYRDSNKINEKDDNFTK